MSTHTFFRSLLRDPMHVGTFSPASSFTADRVAKALPANPKAILELGAGDGALTRALLKSLPEDGRLIAVERDPALAASVSAIGDPRLTVNVADAVGIRAALPDTRFDAIVSSLPFALFSDEVRERLLSDAQAMLTDDGALIVCQHAPTLLPLLRRRFIVDTAFEWRNFPPYFIMRARKKS
jgi:phospholipid N-methyltransferase